MKIGCLIKYLVISTIFFAVLFYLVFNNGDEIKKMAKTFIGQTVETEFINKFKDVKPSAQKDSLNKFIVNYFKNADEINFDLSDNVTKKFLESIDKMVADKNITKEELDEFKTLFANYVTVKKNVK